MISANKRTVVVVVRRRDLNNEKVGREGHIIRHFDGLKPKKTVDFTPKKTHAVCPQDNSGQTVMDKINR